MHAIVPFAAPLSPAGRQAMSGLALPRLSRWLANRAVPRAELGDEWSLTPPHEGALAQALGWPLTDGLLPLAAWHWQALGHAPLPQPMGLLTPAHWHLGTEQLTMTAPDTLALHDDESRAFFAAVAPLFESEGFALHYGSALQWFLVHDSLAALPVASPDRVIGRNVDRWLPEGRHPGARMVRRLQNEVQMLLHTHPLNEERERRGLLSVNSVWLSGCAAASEPPAAGGTAVRWLARLSRPALAEDWAAWAAEWTLLEDELLLLQPEHLVLCGERGALHFEGAAAPRPWWQRLTGAPAPLDLRAAMEAL